MTVELTVQPTTALGTATLGAVPSVPFNLVAMMAPEVQSTAASATLKIELKEVRQFYSGKDAVLDGINLTLDGPKINMLLGPSGCGKSTLLRMLGGVRPVGVKTPTSGEVIINGQHCDGPLDEAITVFQKYTNRPDLTVYENVMLPFTFKLWRRSVPKAEAVERVERFLTEVGLWDKRNLRPAQLSGGQQQRVALARALSLNPKILLMDEPFGALDSQTRLSMQQLLIKLHASHPCMIVFITHDVTEALTVGDRVISLSPPPAKVALDLEIIEPREHEPRSTAWLRSSTGTQLEAQLLQALNRSK